MTDLVGFSATVTEALIFAVAISPSAGSSLIEAAEFPVSVGCAALSLGSSAAQALHGIAVGESVINDPMCIILFTALRKWARPGASYLGSEWLAQLGLPSECGWEWLAQLWLPSAVWLGVARTIVAAQ